MAIKAISRTSFASNAAALREIQRPDCNLAIWQRPAPIDVEELFTGQPSDIRTSISSNGSEFLIKQLLDDAGYPCSPASKALAEDIADLADLFGSITGCETLDIRLAIVESDSCRKFHADWVTSRLITTYSGPGTDWIEHEDAERVANGLEPETINRIEPGGVGIFKGRLSTAQPAIHRSPPISGTGVKRLLLVLDPADDNKG